MSPTTSSRIVFALLSTCVVASSACAQDRTWNLNTDDAWNNSANWDPADVPDTLGENAIVTSPDGTTPVTVTLALSVTREVGDLTILDNGANPDHTVVIPNNTFLDVHGDIQNDGVIELNSTFNVTQLRLDGSDLSLTGAGVVNLGASALNTIRAATGTNTLTNAATHTIAGGGGVGSNSIGINNAGTIEANLSGVTMTVDPNASLGATNTGVFGSSGGGVLSLVGSGGGGFTNTGGVIEAVGADSEVQLSTNASITGGTVRGVGGGLVRAMPSQNVFFTDVTFEGEVLSQNNTDFGVSGTITNNGTITIESTANLTDMEVQAGGATLAGPGKLVLSKTSNGTPRVTGVDDAVLTNGASHTIEGAGALGANATNLVNNGLIDANAVGQTLTIDPDATSGLVNNSTIRASGGGIAVLTGSGGGGFDNTGSLVEAVGSGSEIQLTTDAAVTGGTVRGVGGGLVRAMPSQNVFFTNVTFEGEVLSQNNTDFGVSGTITNNGTITIESTANRTDLEVQAGGATLDGPGKLILSKTANGTPRIDGIDDAVLTNSASHTIEGAGDVGSNSTNLVNNGLINANVAGQTLTIDPDLTAGMDNNAIVRASGGGVAVLSGSGGGGFDNTGGVVEAVGAGSEVQLISNASVIGGTVRAAGGGQVRLTQSQNIFFTDVTFEGEVLSQNNTDFGVSGTITNNGTITLESTFNLTDLEVQAGGATLEGTGRLVLSKTSSGTPRVTGIDEAVLTNGASHTIEGLGAIDTPVVNNGAIAGASATDFIEINRRVSGDGSLENVRIDNVHAPGDDVAVVGLSGDYTIANTGELHIDIGGTTAGTEYDRLASTGDVTLDGDLVVSPINLANGYTPAAGDEFTIITSTSPINGTFDTESLPLIYNERVLLWDPVDYSDPMEVSLRIDVSVLGGDANDDGRVDLLDLDILGSNFGASGAGGPSIGDFDFSGSVDLLDLDILGANFGFGTAVAVPEPSALVLCTLGMVAVNQRRGRVV